MLSKTCAESIIDLAKFSHGGFCIWKIVIQYWFQNTPDFAACKKESQVINIASGANSSQCSQLSVLKRSLLFLRELSEH